MGEYVIDDMVVPPNGFEDFILFGNSGGGSPRQRIQAPADVKWGTGQGLSVGCVNKDLKAMDPGRRK